MSERSERMTAEPVYYYECQERAMAPGIGDGWPEVIAAPHTKNARLVRREGDPAQLRTDLATANERVRVAREGLESAKRSIDGSADSTVPMGTRIAAAMNAIRATLSRLSQETETPASGGCRLNARGGGEEGSDAVS